MKQVSKYVFGAIVGALSFAGLSASDKADNAKDDAPIVADASELQDKTEKFNPVIVELFFIAIMSSMPASGENTERALRPARRDGVELARRLLGQGPSKK